jgi:hypothetical protein
VLSAAVDPARSGLQEKIWPLVAHCAFAEASNRNGVISIIEKDGCGSFGALSLSGVRQGQSIWGVFNKEPDHA